MDGRKRSLLNCITTLQFPARSMMQCGVTKQLFRQLRKMAGTISSTGGNAHSLGKPFVVSIEGNIGCGKSTFINYFKGFPDIETFTEPVPQWQNVNGHNLLELLYKDPARWSFAFQSIVQLTRLKIQTQPSSARVKLIERSLQNNRFCFLELGKTLNDFTEAEYAVLKHRYEWLEQNMDIGVDLIVYLRTDPAVVFERVQRRNRAEEKQVSLEYLRQVHDFYEQWLIEKHPNKPPAPVVVIDANQNLKDLETSYTALREDWLVL